MWFREADPGRGGANLSRRPAGAVRLWGTVILISLLNGRAFGGLVHPGDERRSLPANQLSGAAATPAIDPWQCDAPRVLADAPPRQVQSALEMKAQTVEADDQIGEVAAADDSLDSRHPLWDGAALSPSSARLSIPTVDA